jgi:putative glutamine amidotransferase
MKRIPFSLRVQIFLFVSLWTISATEAATCRLPAGQTLTIGCTSPCSWIMKKRIEYRAKKLGYKISFRDLSQQDSVEDALSLVDAVIIPGGADINPDYYVEGLPTELAQWINENRDLYIETEEGHRRDPFEFNLAQTYLNDEKYRELPLLGICRGMQMMTVASGIPLYLDIKTELGIKNPKHKFQAFSTIRSDSLMGEWFPNGTKWVWQNHHQGLRYDYFKANAHLYPRVSISASSYRDRIVEAIEWDHRTAIGVQFHPESSRPKVARKIFNWLLIQGCQKKLKDGN